MGKININKVNIFIYTHSDLYFDFKTMLDNNIEHRYKNLRNNKIYESMIYTTRLTKCLNILYLYRWIFESGKLKTNKIQSC